MIRKPVMKLGRYELLEKLGIGSDGLFFRGSAPDGTAVEVRLLSGARLNRERWIRLSERLQVAQKLIHPGVEHILDLDLEHDPPYVVLKWQDAPDLVTALVGSLPEERMRALRLVRLVADALLKAHRLGLAHGRLFPSSIRRPNPGKISLDFSGTEPTFEELSDPSHALDDRFRPPDTAPESFAADIYSLGAILVWLFKGTPPSEKDLPCVGEKTIDRLIQDMLAPVPEERPSAEAVFQRISELMIPRKRDKARTESAIDLRLYEDTLRLDDKPGSGIAESNQPNLLPHAGRVFLDNLVRFQLISPESIEPFLQQNAASLYRYADVELLGNDLVQAGYLTEYQLSRILSGTPQGLVLGNYRILELLGKGSMGEVFLAEQVFMKRRLALKLLSVDEDCNASTLSRFYAEMHVLASLQHPHIVSAYDAGKLPAPGPNMPDMLYLAMELVPGGDLRRYVARHGTVDLWQACEWIRQAASGLKEAHCHRLIHRDVKPSNLLLTQEGQVKLCDFGLVRQLSMKLTDRKAMLGSVEFMAPEQGRDPSNVNSQADIYGLGATLFYLLTGEAPYPKAHSIGQALLMLQSKPPRSLRSLRPDLPDDLHQLVDQMLCKDPSRRPELLVVIKSLTRICRRYPPLEQNAAEVVPS